MTETVSASPTSQNPISHCKAACDAVGDCNAVEWYAAGWGGTRCRRILSGAGLSAKGAESAYVLIRGTDAGPSLPDVDTSDPDVICHLFLTSEYVTLDFRIFRTGGVPETGQQSIIHVTDSDDSVRLPAICLPNGGYVGCAFSRTGNPNHVANSTEYPLPLSQWADAEVVGQSQSVLAWANAELALVLCPVTFFSPRNVALYASSPWASPAPACCGHGEDGHRQKQNDFSRALRDVFSNAAVRRRALASPPPNCESNGCPEVPFATATAACAANGLRLCAEYEIATPVATSNNQGTCCGSGCVLLRRHLCGLTYQHNHTREPRYGITIAYYCLRSYCLRFSGKK